MNPDHLLPYLIFTAILILIISVSSNNCDPSPELLRKYGSNTEYDKDMLESMLKEVLNDEITKLSGKPSSRGISDDRSNERLETSHRKSSAVGMDDYLDRLTGSSVAGGSSSERQSPSSDYRSSSLMERPSLSDGR